MKGQDPGPGWTNVLLLFALSSAFFKYSWQLRWGLPDSITLLVRRLAFAAVMRSPTLTKPALLATSVQPVGS